MKISRHLEIYIGKKSKLKGAKLIAPLVKII